MAELTMSMVFTFALDGVEHAVGIAARRPRLLISIDGRDYPVEEIVRYGEDCVLLSIEGRRYRVWRTWEGDRIHLRIDGRSFSVGFEDPITAAHHHAGGEDVLRADMPGVVVSVDCEAGQHVAGGDVLMVTESMKMQINVVAPRDGIIEQVHVEANQTFDKGADLVKLHEES